MCYLCVLPGTCDFSPLTKRKLQCLKGELTQTIFLQSTQNEKLWAYANYEYDALGRRLRLTEIANYENKTLNIDLLMLYREVTKAMT